MKKIAALGVVIILILSLLTACGGNNSGGGSADSNTGNAAKATKGVIKASALISIAEAAALLGQDMEDAEITERHFIDESHYMSKDYHFDIALWQEALYDANSDFEKGLLKNGWASYMREMEKAFSSNYYSQNIVELGGIDGASYLQEGVGMGQWMLHIFYGDYYISLNLNNTSLSHADSEDEISWKQEKLKNAGNLAVENLKAILG
ncbi:MAG: hypothetical protein FWE80_06555 [Oscillospiraceae bacterium]|nr:hypothetical protein [Oscillospiraceae bacterium]